MLLEMPLPCFPSGDNVKMEVLDSLCSSPQLNFMNVDADIVNFQ